MNGNAYTEYVPDCSLVTYRNRQRRAGRMVVLSSPTRGGFYVTTAAAPRRGVTR